MAGLSDTGLEIKTLELIDSEIEEDIHGNVSSTLNLSSTSALGQYKGSTASQLRQVWEALQSLWASWDPRQATGAALDRLGALVGATRRPATYSVVTMTLDLDAGVYSPGSLIVSKVGDSTARFSNVDTITAPGGSTAGHEFRAEDTGPVVAEAGLLTVIANPITGFNSATNPADAIAGDPIESNAAFRRRRELELALKGSTTVDAIRADLLQVTDEAGVPLFDFVSVIENDQDNYDGDGRPPHSFETLVVGGSDAEVAAAILAAKPAGIQAYGLESEVVTDSQNNPHTIGFSRPTPVLIELEVNADVIAGQYVGDDAVKDALVAWAEEFLSVGYDVIHARTVQVVMDLPGVVDAHVFIFTSITTPLEQNFEIDAREIAQIAKVRITVDSTNVGGNP